MARKRGRPRNKQIDAVRQHTGTSRRSAYRAKSIVDAGLHELHAAGAKQRDLLHAIENARHWNRKEAAEQERFKQLVETLDVPSRQDGTIIEYVLIPGRPMLVRYGDLEVEVEAA